VPAWNAPEQTEAIVPHREHPHEFLGSVDHLQQFTAMPRGARVEPNGTMIVGEASLLEFPHRAEDRASATCDDHSIEVFPNPTILGMDGNFPVFQRGSRDGNAKLDGSIRFFQLRGKRLENIIAMNTKRMHLNPCSSKRHPNHCLSVSLNRMQFVDRFCTGDNLLEQPHVSEDELA
jgi:hypothetical protein